MKQDTHKTVVTFLIDRSEVENEPPSVFAFFPNNPEGSGIQSKVFFLSYDSIGQHSRCHIDYAKKCIVANAKQYEPLKRELEGLGYNLKVTNL